MATKLWRIEEFQGIDQSRDGALCNEGTSPYACNMDTSDGNLAVAKGMVRHIEKPVPGTGPLRRLLLMPLMNELIYAAIAEDEDGCMNIYAHDPKGGEWHSVYRYPAEVTGRYWDFLQCNIGNYDYTIIACGEHQMIKWDGINGEAQLFGSGEQLSDAHANYIAMHFSRLFAAGDPAHPSRLYYSQLAGDGRSIEDWGPDEASPNSGGGSIEVGDSVGDPIMGLVALSTQLLIIKRYSVYRLLGDRPSNYTVERVDAEVERMTHTSVAMHADVAFYLTPAGIYYFNNITVQPMPDSRNIRTFLDGTFVSQSKACEAKDCLYFTCYFGGAEDTRAYDNHMIVYDLRRRTYMLRNGFDAADITALDGVLYLLEGDRNVYRFNEGDDYAGRPIAAVWNTQCTDWQARAVDKKIDEIYLRGECGESSKAGAAMLFTTRFGGREHVYRALVKHDPEEMLEIRPDSDWARTFQFRIANEAGSRFALHGGLEATVIAQERPR